MGTPTQTTNKSETKDPWGPSQPYLADIMGQASSLYGSNAGRNPYSGPFVAPTNTTLQQGFDRTLGQAGADTSGAYNYGQGVINSGGMTPGMHPALAAYKDAAAGRGQFGQFGQIGREAGNTGSTYGNAYDALASGSAGQNQDVYEALKGTGGKFNSIYGQTQGPSASERNLTGVAEGEATTNPYLQAQLDDSTNRINRRIASSMSGAGRYGSAGHEGIAAKAIAEANNPLLVQEYDTAMNRKLAANNQIDSTRAGLYGLGLNAAQGEAGVSTALGGLRNADVGLQSGLLGAGAGVRQTGIGQQLTAANAGTSNQLAGAGGLLGAYQTGQGQAAQWAGLAPTLDALRYSGADRTTGIGQWQQGQDQASLDAIRQLANQRNMEPWQMLQQYAGIAGPMGGMGGTATGTSTTETQQPFFNQLAGGAIGGAGLLGQLGGFGNAGWLYGNPNAVFGGGKVA